MTVLLPQHSWIVVTKTIWHKKPKIFIISLFAKQKAIEKERERAKERKVANLYLKRNSIFIENQFFSDLLKNSL